MHDASSSVPRLTPPRDKEKIPRILVRAVGVLMLASLALASYARLTDAPLAAAPQEGPIAEAREIRIYAERTGAATVLDAYGGVIARLDPSDGGFIAGVARALAQVRKSQGVAADAAVRLVRYQDGRLALRDPHTGWRAELVGFGEDNAAAFAALLKTAPENMRPIPADARKGG